MKKKTCKIILKIMAVLATIDITDMAAKGQFLAWLKIEHPEAAEDWEMASTECESKFLKIRPNIIHKISNIFYKAFS